MHEPVFLPEGPTTRIGAWPSLSVARMWIRDFMKGAGPGLGSRRRLSTK
jgi:hypothetical protein